MSDVYDEVRAERSKRRKAWCEGLLINPPEGLLVLLRSRVENFWYSGDSTSDREKLIEISAMAVAAIESLD